MEHRRNLRTSVRTADPLQAAIRQGVVRGRALHGQAVRDAFAALFGFLARLARLRRTRVQLAQLDDRSLADIGLTPADAQKESQKPCWRV